MIHAISDKYIKNIYIFILVIFPIIFVFYNFGFHILNKDTLIYLRDGFLPGWLSTPSMASSYGESYLPLLEAVLVFSLFAIFSGSLLFLSVLRQILYRLGFQTLSHLNNKKVLPYSCIFYFGVFFSLGYWSAAFNWKFAIMPFTLYLLLNTIGWFALVFVSIECYFYPKRISESMK